MKDFMLIFVGASYEELKLSPDEMQAQMKKWFEWIDKLKKDDRYVSGNALKDSAKKIVGAEAVVSDGPFAEANELVGGYFIVKAKDLDEAATLAQDFPDYGLGGGVEVREVLVYNP